MTTSQMNAEVLHSKIGEEQQKVDSTLMSKEEFFDKLDKAEEEYQKGNYTTLQPGESVIEMLNRCGYGV